MGIHGKLPYFVIEPAPWRKEKLGMMGKRMDVLAGQGIPKPNLVPDWNATAIYHKDQQYNFGRPELLATLGNDNEWSIKSFSPCLIIPSPWLQWLGDISNLPSISLFPPSSM